MTLFPQPPPNFSSDKLLSCFLGVRSFILETPSHTWLHLDSEPSTSYFQYPLSYEGMIKYLFVERKFFHFNFVPVSFFLGVAVTLFIIYSSLTWTCKGDSGTWTWLHVNQWKLLPSRVLTIWKLFKNEHHNVVLWLRKSPNDSFILVCGIGVISKSALSLSPFQVWRCDSV